ncbi:MAG TPA: hypothetical protein VFA76_13350 [Terriglobales bacterium]|nr:hypothetical protein [Terriglobales bacterium]
MDTILSLRPNVTRDEAVRQMSAGISGLLRNAYPGPLRVVSDFYLPFRVFRTEIRNGAGSDSRLIGIDVVNGSLDIFSFGRDAPETIRVQTRNRVAPVLNDGEAQYLLVEKIRRVVFRRGFFRLRDFSIVAQPIQDLYVPYWAGFSGRGTSAHITVLNAVRRRIEGGKVRQLLHGWLVSEAL